ncbi:MAG: hypothetical protein QG671_1279 [Actinomycetota bacterium]|jgi:hypothetical protein|nr:hypothetical protein [Actinomycetota bacterium]HQZ84619.1 hypothetical protein [Actinomycetota bacterium]
MDAPETRPDLIPLIDLDRGEADQLVDALTNVGLEAVTARVDTGGPDGALTRSLVRVFVPRSELSDARRVVAGVLPQMGTGRPKEHPPEATPADSGRLDVSESEQWSQIVADLRADGVSTEVPAGADVAPARRDDFMPDQQDRFTPPDPPPLPRLSRAAMAAWAAIVGGIGLVVLSTILGLTGILTVLGVAGFVAGFIALVARAGSGRSGLDDHDDGAVV